MTYVVVIMDMDDVDVSQVIGPFETEDAAEFEGRVIVDDNANKVLPGHARVHEWDYFIQPLNAPHAWADDARL